MREGEEKGKSDWEGEETNAMPGYTKLYISCKCWGSINNTEKRKIFY